MNLKLCCCVCGAEEIACVRAYQTPYIRGRPREKEILIYCKKCKPKKRLQKVIEK